MNKSVSLKCWIIDESTFDSECFSLWLVGGAMDNVDLVGFILFVQHTVISNFNSKKNWIYIFTRHISLKISFQYFILIPPNYVPWKKTTFIKYLQTFAFYLYNKTKHIYMLAIAGKTAI